MYINNSTDQVTQRHQRPSFSSRTALLVYFLNDGQYTDPYQISSVSIFTASSNFYPSSVIADSGEIKSAASSLILLNYSNSASLVTDSSFDASNYTNDSSGIFKLGTGKYAVVLSPNLASSVINLSGLNTLIVNGVSSTGDYIDVWTIRRTATSDLDTVINKFNLKEDRFYTLTEPVLFRVATRLVNQYIPLGSKVDLKFTNEFTIENGNIDQSVANLFNESFVLDPAIEIYKENSDRNLPARITVSSFSQTSSVCDVTSDNTVIYTFDTSILSSHSNILDGTFGALTGRYTARLKFSALNQTIYSNYFSFIVQ